MYKRQVLDALGKTGAPAAAPAQEARLPAASRQDFFQTMDAKTFRQDVYKRQTQMIFSAIAVPPLACQGYSASDV